MKKTVFRILAVLLGLSVILLVELGLQLAGIGQLSDVADPFVGFAKTTPLFVKNKTGNRYEVAKSRQVFFQPDGFDVVKPAREFRVFCLGGSTVQGRPYSIETSFTQWLELSLQAADPSRNWEVVNCGGVSYASYRLIPIAKEVVSYQPDLLIVYTGHNEFLEERSYAKIKRQPDWLMALQSRLSGWRIYGALWQLTRQATPLESADTLPGEVEALLDYQGGLEKYRRDDEWRDGVVQHYAYNLRQMIRIAREAGVPIVFANPVANIRDTPPFKAEVSETLTPNEQVGFLECWERAKDASWEDLDAKLAAVKQALAIDRRHAEACYLQAKVYDALGRKQEALQSYLTAKDEDVCPLRMLESMHRALETVVGQTKTELVDVRAEFHRIAAFGIPGDEQLIDHVHPRIEQHQMIASMFLDWMVGQGFARREPGWEERRSTLYQQNYRSLADNYFPESIERLRGLQRWTQGRVMRMRLDDSGAGVN